MRVPINNNFGVLLAQKRAKEKKNIPLSEVAAETGISRPTLVAWANNTVTRFDLPVIEALCQYFNVGLSGLLEYIPPEQNMKNPESHTEERKGGG
jgi:transcriptional regulator with XRE-family HTH domain